MLEMVPDRLDRLSCDSCVRVCFFCCRRSPSLRYRRPHAFIEHGLGYDFGLSTTPQPSGGHGRASSMNFETSLFFIPWAPRGAFRGAPGVRAGCSSAEASELAYVV